MKRHEVLLYNPRAVFYTMPLALMAVGSALDAGRYRVSIVDARVERDPLAAVADRLPDALCLGVSVLSGAPIEDALRITRAAKRRRPDLPIVWGGWHPSLFPLQTLEEPDIDVAVVGQGERSFARLVDRLAGGEPPVGIPGTASRTEDGPTLHRPRPLEDVNALPAHDYDLIPVETYFRRKGRRQLDYVSSVGCRHRCAFCADPLVYDRRWIGLEASRVVEEVEQLWHRYQLDDLSFQDEAFFTDAGRAVGIAEGFLQRDLPFSWRATLRPDQAARLPDEMVALCCRSGLRRVMVGVESGSQAVLDLVKKDTTVEQVVESAERFARHDLGATFSFIVGFPGESDVSVRETLALVKRLRGMSSRFETPIFYFKPYGGSRLGQEAVRRGYAPPQTLEQWTSFDYIGSAGPWVSREKRRLVERFKFYSRFAWDRDGWCRRPLQAAARWRCERDEYRLPWERVLVETLKRMPRLNRGPLARR